jgi:hypothetical protein
MKDIKEWLETAMKAIPFIQAYPLWVQLLTAIWIFISAAFLVALIVAKPSRDSSTQTGDVVIDRVLVNLAKLPRPFQDSALRDTLAPLFNRPAFYSSRAQDWGEFLYALCRTRLLLEEYMNEFHSPDIRVAISQAVQLMTSLQNSTAELYGPGLNLSAHIGQTIGNSTEFIRGLPKMVSIPDKDFIEARNAEISQLRAILSKVGLVTN